MKSINWAYQQEPGPWTGGRSIYAPRGKTLGGSSSINGHIYNRGQRQDFDTWAQLGNRGWGYPDVLPYFKRLERRIGEGEDAYRGRDGQSDRHHHGLAGPALRGVHGGRDQPRHSAETPITTARSRRASPTPSAPSRTACASVRRPRFCIRR